MDASTLQLTVCGHAKSGKSTLAGRLAFELRAPNLTDSRMQAFAEEADLRNTRFGKKDFNKYNLIFLPGTPVSPQSMKEGVIKSPSRSVFPVRGSLEVDGTRLTLVDTPGHETFLNNIAYGIFQSDAAILTIEPEGDLAVKKGTEMICRLLTAFDVPVVAICVTKMDRLGFSQEVFETLSAEIVGDLVERYGLIGPDGAIPLIPVAALAEGGDNVATKQGQGGANMPWYHGPTVADAIARGRQAAEALPHGPVRFAVEGPAEIFSPGVGTVLVGVLESGTLRTGQILVAEPFSTAEGEVEQIRVRSLQLGGGVAGGIRLTPSEIAARCSVALSVSDWSRERAEKVLRHGGMLGERQSRPRVARRIRAEVLFFADDRVYHGKDYKVLLNASFTMARFLALKVQDGGWMDLHRHSEATEAAVGVGEWVEAEIEFHQRPFCIETAESMPKLSRFGLVENNQVVGCGKCTAILA